MDVKSTFSKNGYTTSTNHTRELRSEKDALWKQGYPSRETLQFIHRHYRAEHYAHLKGKNAIFLPAPSTSGKNSIPTFLSHQLAKDYGGSVISQWAIAASTTKAANKGGLQKLRDPQRFKTGANFNQIPPNRPIVLVDDVVTTGYTTDGLRLLLHSHGHHISNVASLGQSELRLASARDLERLDKKLGTPSLKSEIDIVYGGHLKHKLNYIERAIRPNNKEEIRDLIRAESQRISRALGTEQRTDRSLAVGARANRLLQPGSEQTPSVSREHSSQYRSLRGKKDRAPSAPDTRGVARDTSLEEKLENIRRSVQSQSIDLRRGQENILQLLQKKTSSLNRSEQMRLKQHAQKYLTDPGIKPQQLTLESKQIQKSHPLEKDENVNLTTPPTGKNKL